MIQRRKSKEDLAVRKELSDGSLVRLPVTVPEFSFDIHFSPEATFAGKEVCRMLRCSLEDSLQ